MALDCEQFPFFFRFSKGSARARKRWASKPRDARNEGGRCLSRLAPSVTRVVIYVSRAFCSTDEEKRETARSLSCYQPLQLLEMFHAFSFLHMITVTKYRNGSLNTILIPVLFPGLPSTRPSSWDGWRSSRLNPKQKNLTAQWKKDTLKQFEMYSIL